MAFTTPCFVRVEDPAEREKLIEWLEYIGHDVCICCHFEKHNTLYCDPLLKATFDVHGFPDKEEAIGFTIERLKRENALKEYPSYDCGTNVELFRALAAMNVENDREQWFTNGRGYFVKCPDAVVTKRIIPSYSDFRKAKVHEIIQLFKTMKK